MTDFTDFPAFTRNEKNAIDPAMQSKGVVGYLWDGADGSQVGIWTCDKNGISREHTHPYDEYFVIVQGAYILIIGNRRIELRRGDEYFIKAGTPHSGEFTAGTRTIHIFGGKRAERKKD